MAATKDVIANLQDEIARLQAALRAAGINVGMATPAQEIDPAERPDYIAFGSPEHAEFLGLREAAEDDEITVEGWALQDITQWGPAATKDFLRGILRQKVNTLVMPFPEGQSEDPAKPHFRPTMWQPGLEVGDVTNRR